MAGTQAQQQGFHQPRQSACYLCEGPFSTDNIRKIDLGSRKVTLKMIPPQCQAELIKARLFTKQECQNGILQVCCLCKGFVEKSFTVQERVRHLTNPVMLQWVLKMMGWTKIRTERERKGSNKFVHGLELLDEFDADSNECQKFKRTWLSAYPLYPAPSPYPDDGEGLVEPYYYEEVVESEQDEDYVDELSNSESESDEEEHEEDGDSQSGSDLDEEASEDELLDVNPEVHEHEDDISNDSDDIAANLIASTPSTSKAVNKRHPSQNRVAAKALARSVPNNRAETISKSNSKVAKPNSAAFQEHLNRHANEITALRELVDTVIQSHNRSIIKGRELKVRVKASEKAMKKLTTVQQKEVQKSVQLGQKVHAAEERLEGVCEYLRGDDEIEDAIHDRLHNLEVLVPGATVTVVEKRKREDTRYQSVDDQSSIASPIARHPSIKYNSRGTHSQETDDEDNASLEEDDNDRDDGEDAAPPTKRQKRELSSPFARDPRTIIAHASTSRASVPPTATASSATGSTAASSNKNHLYLGRRPRDLERFSSNLLPRDVYPEEDEDDSGSD